MTNYSTRLLTSLCMFFLVVANVFSAPTWFKDIRNNTWQATLANKATIQIVFEDQRYFIFKGEDVLLDQGGLRFADGQTVYLLNRNGKSSIKISGVSKSGFSIKGSTRLTLKRYPLDGKYSKHNKSFDAPMPSSIYLAARYGDTAALEGFTRTKIPIDGDKKSAASPLAYAVYYHHTAAVQLLLKKGANPDYVTKAGKSILELAIESGHVDAARMLIAKGANVNRKAKTGVPLVNKALAGDSLDIVKLLVAKGAKIGKLDNHGHPALYHAMASFSFNNSRVREKLAFTKFVVEKGGYDPKTIDSHGRNILFYAANLGLADTVKYLLSKGVDPNVKAKDGKNVFEYIEGSDYKDKVMPLLAKYKK